MFKIICLKCNEEVTIVNGQKPIQTIVLRGQIECLFDADVYIDCKCGNSAILENRQ